MLSLVQYNQEGDVVSGIFLCNYPNVPALPQQDWIHWLRSAYGKQKPKEKNTVFVHLAVWNEEHVRRSSAGDKRGSRFFKQLLTAVFEVTTHCDYILLVYPPYLDSEDIVELYMGRYVPQGLKDTMRVQSLYMCKRRHMAPCPRMRRLVEEDNDDLVNILDAIAPRFKELYGEYYISEMSRYPDSRRHLIVSEDSDGLPTGLMCLTTVIDVDLLNDHFEIAPYNGLRRRHPNDIAPTQSIKSSSQTVFIMEPTEDRDLGENKMIEVKHLLEKFAANQSTLRETDPNEDWHGHKEERRGSEKRVHIGNMSAVEYYTETLLPKELKTVSSPNFAQASGKGIPESPNARIYPVTHPPSRSALKTPKSSFDDGRTTPKHHDMKAHDPAEEHGYGDNDALRVSILQLASQSGSKRLKRIDPGTIDANIRLSVFGDDLNSAPRSSMVVTTEKSEVSNLYNRHTQKPGVYLGAVNAFVIEIFATVADMDDYWAKNFLQAAFECFPHLDYCVMMMPYMQPYFPFLRHFLRVPVRCNKEFTMALFLTHKFAFNGILKPREGETYDYLEVCKFVASLPHQAGILLGYNEALLGEVPGTMCYIFECDQVIVGLIILCFETDMDLIKAYYNVDDQIDTNNIPPEAYGRILYYILMPIFSLYQRFFLREVMRISEYTVLLHRLYNEDFSGATRIRPLPTCLSALIPVKPRIITESKFFCGCIDDGLELENERGDDNEEEEQRKAQAEKEFTQEDELFALYMTTPRLAMMPKPFTCAKIVIVGASDCGVAFSEELALTYRLSKNSLHFTNVTLISPHGLPFVQTRSRLVISMLPYFGHFSVDYRRRVGARTWMNIICGTVTSINRKQKYVSVMNQGQVSYDYLILTCGLQYGKPMFPEELEAQKRGEPTVSPIPWNCIAINDDTDAYEALTKIRRITKDLTEEKQIIFYGSNLDCFCAIQAILRYGVPGSWITLIEAPLNPCETHDNAFFNDTEVDVTVTKAIKENGISVISSWLIVDWTIEKTQDGEMIRSIVLDSKTNTQTLFCDALFVFHEKTINMHFFLAICRAGLVFDGQLVIDPECRTNDPYIFAGGTITKYSRKLYASAREHKYYNSVEVGETLGKIIRREIEMHWNKEAGIIMPPVAEFPNNMPRFNLCFPIFCILPDGYRYLHVRKPGRRISRKIPGGGYGTVLTTGAANMDIGYCRIRLNTCDTVETITCMHKKNFDVHNMISLYGKHEKMLNRLKLRYQKGQIIDFFAYFRESWAAALFHDGFDGLRDANRKMLMSNMGMEDGDTLTDDCIEALKRHHNNMISPEDRKEIELKFEESIYRKEIEQGLYEYLDRKQHELPVYCVPRTLRQMYDDIEGSPLFYEQ